MSAETVNLATQPQEVAVAEQAAIEVKKVVEVQEGQKFDPAIQDDSRGCGSCPRDYNI